MLNRATNNFNEFARSGSVAVRWRVDQQPVLRLFTVFFAITVPLAAVGYRLVYLQLILSRDFVGKFETTVESFEAIPARDGRILASDGRVLADDALHMNIAVHYRWLEEPPDENWLRYQALSQLSRRDRRNAEQVEAAKRDVLARRREMWQRFADLTGSQADELAAERARIQDRVERIVTSVERSLEARMESRRAADRSGRRPDEPWWQHTWHTFIEAITTPPYQPELEPLVVQEELQYHLLLENVGFPVAAEIEANPEWFPGLRVQTSTQRVYPHGPIAAHIVGSRLPITNEQIEARARSYPDVDPLDYQPGDRMGRTGVERTYDRHLRGLDGLRRIITVRRGSRRGEVLATEVVREPRNGRDIELTLNLSLQQRMESLLDDVLAERVSSGETSSSGAQRAGGCIVAIDVHTGALLAAASAPRFDLNMLVETDAERWQAALDDPRRPFFHRAIQMTLPPGSVFKTLTAVALLESNQFDPDEHIFCRGYLDNPNRYRCYVYRHYGYGHGETDLSDALCRSCNVYFFSAARRMGPELIVEWAQRFGFGKPTGIDLPGERSGNLPVPGSPLRSSNLRDSNEKKQRVPWYPGDTLQLAIGQSRLTATPLQIARLIAAIANDGHLLTPHVVAGFGPVAVEANTSERLSSRDPRRIPGLSDDTLQRIRLGMKRVVADPQGTGYKRVRMKEITIAGKSGTAEVGGGRGDHAWFAGYVPAEEPRVAFAVVLEHAGSGGREAGPLARRLVEALLVLDILHTEALAAQ